MASEEGIKSAGTWYGLSRMVAGASSVPPNALSSLTILSAASSSGYVLLYSIVL